MAKDPDQDPYRLIQDLDNPFRWSEKCTNCDHSRADHIQQYRNANRNLNAVGVCNVKCWQYEQEEEDEGYVEKTGPQIRLQCSCPSWNNPSQDAEEPGWTEVDQ